MFRCLTWRPNSSPKILSPSRSRYRGICSNGNTPLVKIFMRRGYSTGVSRPGVLDSGCEPLSVRGRTLWVGGQYCARSSIVAHHQESDNYEYLFAVVLVCSRLYW